MKYWRKSLLGQWGRLYQPKPHPCIPFIASTGQLTDLTPGPIDIDLVTLSADKTKALCVGAEFRGKGPVSNSLYVLDLEAARAPKSQGTRVSATPMPISSMRARPWLQAAGCKPTA